MEILYVALFLAAGALFALVSQTLRGRWQTERGIRALRQWAEDQQFRLVFFERKFYKFGPLRIFSHTSTLVFYVEVLDANSKPRKGQVKIGNWLGDIPDEIQVIWSDENRNFQWW